jgi:acetyl-CoA acetyltransferase
VNRAGRDVAVVGVGYSPTTRAGTPDIRTLTVEAARDALADAGLQASDLDSIFEYSFGGMRADSPIAVQAQRLLGIENLTAFNDIMGTGPSGLASAMDAAMAIAAGACETALVYRTITRVAGHTGALREGPPRAPGAMQFSAPYGYGGGIILAMAMKKRRRVAELGGSYEDYGQIALNARRWAALNPRGVFREPITMDDYFDSRTIADPLLLFDCDYPVNASCAAILTTAERARDLRQPAVIVDALAYGTGARPDWLYADDFVFGGTIPCGRELWRRSSVTSEDVDVAELYDGFTHITISWLEALGLCGIGEFHDWVDDGKRIGPGGSMPLNTYGGQLAAGRMHGLAFLTEAVLQLRGDCGERQVPDARVAVVANAHGPQCGAMVVRRDS